MQFGPLVKAANDACLTAAAVPVTLRHAKKLNNRQAGYEALDMDDLTQTGFAEHARQWLLLNRRERYAGGGVHGLFMSSGGSVGHSAEYALDIDDGVMDDAFAGKKWRPNVMNMGQVAESQKALKAQRAAAKAAEQMSDDVDALVGAVGRLTRTETTGAGGSAKSSPVHPIPADIKAVWGKRAVRFNTALGAALGRTLLEPVTVLRQAGKGATREHIGYRRPIKIESCVQDED